MGFWSLFEVASMPILQVLLISILGAFMATEYLNLLPADARRSLNKVMHAMHICINLWESWPFFSSVSKGKQGQDDHSSTCCFFNLKFFELWVILVAYADCLHGVHSITDVCQSGQDCYAPRHHFMVGYFCILCDFYLWISFSSVKLCILFAFFWSSNHLSLDEITLEAVI
jgi:hypothetical protein